MRSAIAVNGAFFNTQRMVAQFVLNAYHADEARNRVIDTEKATVIDRIAARSA